jgi:hypothetical protein
LFERRSFIEKPGVANRLFDLAEDAPPAEDTFVHRHQF